MRINKLELIKAIDETQPHVPEVIETENILHEEKIFTQEQKDATRKTRAECLSKAIEALSEAFGK